MARVSVIMPVYKAGVDFLALAVQSILEQTYRDLELIIVNDGDGIDYEAALGPKINDRRIRYLVRRENGGISEALNTGIASSDAPFLARMDADDLCHPIRIETQMSALSSHRHAQFVGTGCKIIEADGTRVRFYIPPLEPEAIKFAINYKNPFLHPSMLVSRTGFHASDLLYDKEFEPAEDYAYFSNLLGKAAAINLSAPLVCYRQHQSSISSTRRNNQLRLYKAIAAQNMSRSVDFGSPPYPIALDFAECAIGESALTASSYESCAEYIVPALRRNYNAKVISALQLNDLLNEVSTRAIKLSDHLRLKIVTAVLGYSVRDYMRLIGHRMKKRAQRTAFMMQV